MSLTVSLGALLCCTAGLVMTDGALAQPRSHDKKGGSTPTYQLYSWQESEGGWWNFSLLPDTNRQKTVKEVFNPKKAFRGLEQWKQGITGMPEGSRLVWFDRLTIGEVRVKESDRLKYPPGEIVAEVRRHAQSRNIEILGPP